MALKYLKILADVTALLGAIAGSFIIAADIGLSWYGYWLFLASSIACIYLLVTTKGSPRSILLQNLYFVGVNLFGLIRHAS